MIIDTLAAMAATKSNTIDYNTSVEEIFNKLVELEQKGLINFEYEVITVRGQPILNAKINEWKYLIKGLLSRNIGIGQIQDAVLNELIVRIELYEQGVLYDEHVDLNIDLPEPFQESFYLPDYSRLQTNYDTPFPLNLRLDVADPRDFSFVERQKDGTPLSLPLTLDYSNEMSPVKDQKKLGSCVAFACCAVKEWQEGKEHKLDNSVSTYSFKDKFQDLSEQWVYYMTKKIDPWPNLQGTSIRCAMKVLNKIGVPNEKGWPYNDLIRGAPELWAHLISRWNVIGSYERITSLEQMRQTLNDNGPFVAGMLCFENFFSSFDGIIPMPKNNEKLLGGHAVCVVGYDDAKRLIKFKNSWGIGWGEKGYGFISYDYVPYIIDMWVAKDMKITHESFKKINF